MSDIASTWAAMAPSLNGVAPLLRDEVPMPDEGVPDPTDATGATHPSRLGNAYHRNRTEAGWVCKYDAACGYFPNPVRLGKHYAEVHPDSGHVPSKLKQTGTRPRNGNRGIPEGPRVCNVCNSVLSTKDSTRKHFRRRHRNLYVGDGLAWLHNTRLVGEPAPEPEGTRTSAKAGSGNYACTACDHRLPTMRGICSHYRRKHGARGVHESEMWRLVEGGVGSVPALVEHDEHDPDTELAPDHAPLTADDIVTTVAEAMAYPSGAIPTQHLRPLLTWYDHTRAFLAAVTPDNPAGS